MQKQSDLQFLWSALKAHKIWIFIAALIALPFALSQSYTATLAGKYIGEQLTKFEWDEKKILFYCGAIILVFTVQGISIYIHKVFLRTAIERTVRDLRSRVFEKLAIFSEAQRAPYTAGRAITHITSDLELISQARNVFQGIIKEPLTIIVLLSHLFTLNAKLCIICALAILPISLLGKTLGRRAKRNQKKIQESIAAISHHTADSIGGLRTAHAFNYVPQLKKQSRSLISKGYQNIMNLCRVEESVGPLTKIITSVFGAGLCYIGAYFVQNTKELSLDELITFVVAAGLLQQPFREINKIHVSIQRVLAGAGRIRKILETPLDPLSETQSKLLENPPKIIKASRPELLRFENVFFQYPHKDPDTWALKDINFQMKQGDKVALVGSSGAGKSTFTLLCLRLLEEKKGKITLGNQAAQNWDLDQYRACFSYVSQDIYLFQQSVRENLKIARQDASEEEIWQALERANMMDFVKQLPQGLDTPLEDRAQNLSGGEKQRLALARAFLKDAPFLILDEATSNLDAHNEKLVQASLQEIMKDRSVLIIAHRLSTIRNVDRVDVFEAGSIVESGSPDQLLENNQSKFSALWKSQFSGA